ncbi:BQ2448_6244 [Microbotryum intermedium]|uniref:BQ2448_6244 protein n=1 Tax=Microbotryum intermedium TaxID=269621 RepID=A0A238FPJ6_9BASI|nr:BQ2448_6244 [Microbotryum intermedium]
MSSPSDRRQSSSHDRNGLRSALKKDHVHLEPRPDPAEDEQSLIDSFEADPKLLSFHSDSNIVGSPPHAVGSVLIASGSYPFSDHTSGPTPGSSSSLLHPSDAEAKKSSSSLSLAPRFQRRVGFDTFDSEEVEGSTGGGTGMPPVWLHRKQKAPIHWVNILQLATDFILLYPASDTHDNRSTRGGPSIRSGVSYSFTIGAKSSSYCRARYTRTFLCCTDLNEYSVHALDWLLTSLVEDHDEIVVLRVIEPGSSAHAAWRASIEKAKREAERVLEEVMRKNGEEKQISIIVEFAIGPIEETIHRMVEIYEPDSLIVGTRGKQESLFKPMMGSISKYCVARSPVPVVVVRPEDKVQASLNARRSDSKRQKHLYQLYDDARAATSTPALQGSALERSTTTTPVGAFKVESKQEKKGTKLQKFDTFG